MELKITAGMALKVGRTAVEKALSLDSYEWRHERTVYVDISEMTVDQITVIQKLFAPHKGVTGVNMLLNDLDVWLNAAVNPHAKKIRNLRQFAPLAVNAIARTAHRHLYCKEDEDGQAWLAYYVNEIEYHEERQGKDYHEPAKVYIGLLFEQYGGREKKSLWFYNEDVAGLTVEEALRRKDFFLESLKFRLEYETETEKYYETVKLIGKQYLAVGHGTDDLDGNSRSDDHHWWRRAQTVSLERDGVPSRVVIDVFKEGDDKEKEKKERANESFWSSALTRLTKEQVDAGLDKEDLAEEGNKDKYLIEVPVHPFCAVFDLRKHLRLQVHVTFLTPYEYDVKLAEKLVLPDDVKGLVKLLIVHKEGGFKDIVSGKSGGAVILLTGPPGTGKTLTAEVYAESEQRPLYSVQASQLGTDPDSLESELMKVLLRAKRWNAIMLLDEADVYVHQRGNDLTQNAIVGVFLRVLEYHSSILFMTTNRADDVDDAIASRCVARIGYKTPAKGEQKKIWEILAKGCGIEISGSELSKIVDKHGHLSGRDIKNLLKLAQLVSKSESQPITEKTVTFVEQFKPTMKGDGT